MQTGPATPYLSIQASGELEILNSFTMTGEFGFLVTANGDIEATIDASINILGNTLDVEGGAGIYFGDNRGFAAAITLTLGAGFSGAGFSLTGAFTLRQILLRLTAHSVV